MSIEIFWAKYPANPEVRSSIENIKKTETGKSLIAILAEQLVIEGRDGIRKIFNKYYPGNTMFELDQKSLEKITAEDKQKMFYNYAGIVFGHAVVSLERTLVSREYDHEDFCQRHNLATQGMQIVKAETGDVNVEKLSQDQMGKMYAIVNKDKTFALFFEGEEREEGKETIMAMPHALRRFLLENDRILIIRKAILPLYKERAKFLVL